MANIEEIPTQELVDELLRRSVLTHKDIREERKRKRLAKLAARREELDALHFAAQFGKVLSADKVYDQVYLSALELWEGRCLYIVKRYGVPEGVRLPVLSSRANRYK